jgi:hypothetical protein
MREALRASLDIDVILNATPSAEKTEFQRIRKEQRLKPALAWRDGRFSEGRKAERKRRCSLRLHFETLPARRTSCQVPEKMRAMQERSRADPRLATRNPSRACGVHLVVTRQQHSLACLGSTAHGNSMATIPVPKRTLGSPNRVPSAAIVK